MDTVLFSRPAHLKKGANNLNGSLKISHHHLLWAPGTAGAAQEVKLPVSNISTQQKATKGGQFFIRIVPKNGSPIIFSFENEVDRNTAVEITAPMLSGQPPAPPGSAPPAASTASGRTAAQGQSPAAGPDVALKQKLLSEDRDLKALYDQLMHSGALSDTEFWASHNRQSLLNRTKGKERPAQKAGLSTSMVTDVRTDSDGRSSKAMFRITDNMIPQIFAERPEVHHCYLANVPHNFSDQEFWNKFGNYEWTRRKKQLQKKDKTITLTVEDQELLEMFDRFRRSEQLEKEARMKARQALPSVNLAADGYDNLSSSAAGGFGIAFDGAKEGLVGLSRTSVGTDIIRDLNRHAAVVLEGVGAEASEDHGQVAAALAKLEQSKAKANERVDWDAANHERWKDAAGREARVLPELRAEAAAANEPLRIGDPRKYFDAASGDCAPSASAGAVKSEMPSCGRGCDLQGMNPRSLPCPPIKPSLASQVLTEVGLRVKAAMAEQEDGFMIGDPKDALLPVLQQELRKQALVVNELLRHFWSVFPISSAPRAQKLEKMKDSLSKQYDQLLAMQEAAIGSDRVYISQVLRPCMQALDAAFTKYDAEQDLRANKRQRMARA